MSQRETQVRRDSVDRTPPSIDVWVCPLCGYWRGDESIGIHMEYKGTGKGVSHRLVKARYIFEGEVRDA